MYVQLSFQIFSSFMVHLKGNHVITRASDLCTLENFFFIFLQSISKRFLYAIFSLSIAEHLLQDLTPDYMNVLGMIFSMCALMLRIKWCSWVAVFCSCVSFANTKYTDDTKQACSQFILFSMHFFFRKKAVFNFFQF